MKDMKDKKVKTKLESERHIEIKRASTNSGKREKENEWERK